MLFAPERWALVLGGLVANHLAIGYGTLWPRSRLLGANITRLPAELDGCVGLSFDDGPDPEVTPAVLDILERHGAKASFFSIGRKVDAHAEITALAFARGHAVENHTYHHPNGFAFRTPAGLTTEIQRTQEAIVRATGRPPSYFRPPVGFRNLWLEPCLTRAGLALVTWTRRGFDTVSRDARRVARRITRGVQSGDILLLHDGGSARDAEGQPVVLRALPLVLDALAERKLRAVAIPRPASPS
jgi:peptidoglycan/xylan/chitin deacetylase (PgdA/CDA1 family)